jgi:hypothetical protein
VQKSLSLKTLTLAIALGAFGFTGSAIADDGERGEAIVGIIGEVIGGAVEAEQAQQEALEQERRCRRFNRKCEQGQEWACERYENNCAE